MIEIDGSIGGGQVLRNALAMSLVTGKPFLITRIRESRPKPGLSAQHLACVKACIDLFGSSSSDAGIGTTSLTFTPGTAHHAKAEIDIGTAGSITLLLQAILPPTIFGKKRTALRIRGGTDVRWSMPIDYFTHVLLPHLSNLAKINVRLLKRGYYPKGGGEIEMTITPLGNRNPIRPEGDACAIKGISHSSRNQPDVALRQASAAKRILPGAEIRIEYPDTLSTGSGITLWAVLAQTAELEPSGAIGADCTGDQKRSPEEIGEMAAVSLQSDIAAKRTADTHLSDNLIPYLAIVGGKLDIGEKSAHTSSSIAICEAFLGKRFKQSANVISADSLDTCNDSYSNIHDP